MGAALRFPSIIDENEGEDSPASPASSILLAPYKPTKMPLTSRSKVNAAVLPNVGLQLLNDPAWQTAKATYETQTKIKGNDLDEILNTNGPTDIADFILRIQDGTTKGRYAKTVGIANTCTAFLKEREGAIDMLAQAGGAPGCLTWGCIKLALHVIYQAAASSFS